MALVKCPECGRENVSSKAEACPGCGYNINAYFKKESDYKNKTIRKTRIRTVIIIVSILVLIFVAGYFTTRCRYPDCTEKKVSSDGYCAYHSASNDDEYENMYQDTPISGNESAVAKAQSYLSHSAFSYEGLVDQLEYEGYSASEAEYGVANCGADWELQAVKKAQSYLKSSAFSYNGLIDQLEYEGFTDTQAEYGVKHCDADWNEQAAKQAKSYLSWKDYSRSELIDQLEYEGYTYEQASYGATKAGL